MDWGHYSGNSVQLARNWTTLFQSYWCFDIPVILANTVVYAYLLALTVFLLDFIYALVDPRVRIGGGGKIMIRLRRFFNRTATLSFSARRYHHYSLVAHHSIVVPIMTPYSEALRLWRGGEDIWAQYPRNAWPVWYNLFVEGTLPETIVFDSSKEDGVITEQQLSEGTREIPLSYEFDYQYDDFPPEMNVFQRQNIRKNNLCGDDLVYTGWTRHSPGRILIRT